MTRKTELAGQIAVITGAGSGIGSATAVDDRVDIPHNNAGIARAATSRPPPSRTGSG